MRYGIHTIMKYGYSWIPKLKWPNYTHTKKEVKMALPTN